MSDVSALTREEAATRAGVVRVHAYAVDLDLDQGDHHFGSRSTIRFSARRPGEATFLDIKAQSVASATLNGRALDLASLKNGRLVLADLAADNEVVVEATMAYSRDGQGLHRAVDPADGAHYVYGHLFLDAAPTVFACFDQPDLKAPYTMTVLAPHDWVVMGSGPARQTAPGLWQLATTVPLATYFVTVCAGPYVSARGEHDGIPLGIHARASLGGALERWSSELLELTGQCFDHFHELFGVRYPFGEYHQVFVPEFNAGAMENPGCVTIRDQYLFRGAATSDEIQTRDNTIAHEMAHMWFGNLVTMRWWDDLWLNESFAEYLAHRALVEATRHTDAWVGATIIRKAWGYAAERAPSTHPVAGAMALDAQSALQDFDGIAYAKGAAVLRQLIAYVGDPAFVRALRHYVQGHSLGNADMGDLLGAMELSSGLDLGSWHDAWLTTAGRDEISAARADGRLVVLRVPPAHEPADRPHALDIAGYSRGLEVFRVRATIHSERTELGAVLPAAVVVPNASDLTWAAVTLDDDTVAALPEELALIPDAQTRATIWVALVDSVARGVVDPAVFFGILAAAWPYETHAAIMQRVARVASRRFLPHFTAPALREPTRHLLSVAGHAALERAEAGSSAALGAARLVAEVSADRELLTRWLAGEGLPIGLERDSDFRWIVLGNLADRGWVPVSAIEAAGARDSTLQGALNALRCRASLPDAESKAWAWEQLTSEKAGRSNYELNHLADGFWRTVDDALVRPYVARYFQEIPLLARWVGEDALARLVLLAFPKVVEDETDRLSRAALARTDLTPAVRRAMVDADWEIREALESRRRYG